MYDFNNLIAGLSYMTIYGLFLGIFFGVFILLIFAILDIFKITSK